MTETLENPSANVDRSGCTARYHGTSGAYFRAGCRCPDAKEAKRVYTKRRRLGRPETRRVPALGTTRRIRALMALGHNSTTIGQAAGMSAFQVQQTAGNRQYVSPATRDRIVAAYDALSGTPGVSVKTRSRAQRAGWAPPLAWEYVDLDDPRARPVFGRRRSAPPGFRAA